jgi:hypothetical protein
LGLSERTSHALRVKLGREQHSREIFLFDAKILIFFLQERGGWEQGGKAEVAAISAIVGCIVGLDDALSC